MFRVLSVLCVTFLSFILFGGLAAAHCEIPCGIYDDAARLNSIAEHAVTIEKSMKTIIKIQSDEPINYNQLVRWVSNKESHADAVQHLVSQYFMTQRIKPNTEQYQEKLSLLHKMLIAAMKCKQTVELKNVENLRFLLKEFKMLYLTPEQ